MIRTAELLLKNRSGFQFVVSKSPGVPEEFYACADNIKGVKPVTANIYKILSASDFVISASGTVTLQVAIAGKPMLLTYITSYFTYIAAKIVLKKPIIGLSNILAGKEIVPEFVQMDATAPKMAAAVLELLSSPEKTALMKEELIRVKDMLGKPGASKRAAAIISDLLKD
jgi:lipid-A-disaccharide synthase